MTIQMYLNGIWMIEDPIAFLIPPIPIMVLSKFGFIAIFSTNSFEIRDVLGVANDLCNVLARINADSVEYSRNNTSC